MLLSIPKEEFLERQRRLAEQLEVEKIDAAILFHSIDVFYLTGFYYFVTERPIGLLLDPQGRAHLFVPELEKEHAEEHAYVDYVHTYPEYPGLRHPMEYLKDVMAEYNCTNKVVGYDADGYSSSMGYRGPRLSSLVDATFTSIYGFVEEMRKIKSANEIELLKESCRWGNLAHALLQKYVKAGSREFEIRFRATTEATLAMVEALGSEYKPHGSTATAYFRGQIGEKSAYPHIVTHNGIIRKGDNLITMAKADVFGYLTELERTMFVDEVTKEQEKYFTIMMQAQEIAFKTIRPGKPASDVQKAVTEFFTDQGVLHLTSHHVGHAMGLIEHEAPFFDLGDDTILEPGMVMAVEPGIYVKGLGGFRHSDTVLVTETGMELLTYYPRDLQSLICYS